MRYDWGMVPENQIALLRAIAAIRATLGVLPDPKAREKLRHAEWSLRQILGPVVAKGPAAQALGISVVALDRWINLGALPAVEAPGKRRHGLETTPLIELIERVDQLRAAGRTGRVVAAAIADLHDALPGQRQVIRYDVARLPRSNVSVAALQHHVRTTTVDQRLERSQALIAASSTIQLIEGGASH